MPALHLPHKSKRMSTRNRRFMPPLETLYLCFNRNPTHTDNIFIILESIKLQNISAFQYDIIHVYVS